VLKMSGPHLRRPRLLRLLPVVVIFSMASFALPGVSTSAPSHWADQALSEAAIRGIVKGYPDGSVQPDRSVTRAELCTMIIRMLGEEEAAKTGRRLPSSFRDVDENYWGKGCLEVAREKGIFRGDSGDTAAPDRGVTRAEAVTMLDRCIVALDVPLESVSGEEFVDSRQIPSWARESVKRLAGAGVVVGDVDGRFYPERGLTRAEAATLTLRVLGVVGRRWDIIGRFGGLSTDNTRIYIEAQGQALSVPIRLGELEVFDSEARTTIWAIRQGAEVALVLQDGQARLLTLIR
jgi:hypothetical protein